MALSMLPAKPTRNFKKKKNTYRFLSAFHWEYGTAFFSTITASATAAARQGDDKTWYLNYSRQYNARSRHIRNERSLILLVLVLAHTASHDGQIDQIDQIDYDLDANLPSRDVKHDL